MAHEENVRTEHTVLGFGLGLMTGITVGIGVGMLLAPREGAVLRRQLGEQTKRLRDDATAIGRNVSSATSQLAEQGTDLARRVRVAAGEGIREARRHMETGHESPRATLTGVEGLAEPF
jgi:gas vesicle protein